MSDSNSKPKALSLPEELHHGVQQRQSFFSRPQPPGYGAELAAMLREKDAAPPVGKDVMLLFRIGVYRLALPSMRVTAVIRVPPVCSIPHRRNTAFLGLIAFVGEIVPCCSLARILGAADRASGDDTRLLVLEERPGERWAVPVDAVHNMRIGTIRESNTSQINMSSEGDTHRIGSMWSRHVFEDEEGDAVEVLHVETLFQRMRRALA